MSSSFYVLEKLQKRTRNVSFLCLFAYALILVTYEFNWIHLGFLLLSAQLFTNSFFYKKYPYVVIAGQSVLVREPLYLPARIMKSDIVKTSSSEKKLVLHLRNRSVTVYKRMLSSDDFAKVREIFSSKVEL